MSKNLISNTRNLVFLLLAFTFPLSVALSNILVVLLAVLILVEGSFSEKIQKINSSKWMKSILLLWVMYIIYFFIFGSFTDTFWLIKRISLLLLLPIFYSSIFSEKTIQKSVFAFLISMFLSSVVAIADKYEIIYFTKNWTWSAFLKYTDHNVFLAFSLIISLYSLFRIKLEKKHRNIILFFIPFYLFSIFTEGGKSGQLVFLFSVILFMIFLFKNKWKPLLLSLVSVFVFSAIVYNTSDIVKKRFNSLKEVVKNEKSVRHILLKETIILIKKNPVLGYGTGSFTDEFGSVNEDTKKVVNYQHKSPHNNYLYVWFELGILGLIVFLLIFYFQIKQLIKKEDGIFLILFPIMFLIIMFTDSYLFSQNTLVLYLFLSIVIINYQYKPS
jgi:O-antigen ligase